MGVVLVFVFRVTMLRQNSGQAIRLDGGISSSGWLVNQAAWVSTYSQIVVGGTSREGTQDNSIPAARAAVASSSLNRETSSADFASNVPPSVTGNRRKRWSI